MRFSCGSRFRFIGWRRRLSSLNGLCGWLNLQVVDHLLDAGFRSGVAGGCLALSLVAYCAGKGYCALVRLYGQCFPLQAGVGIKLSLDIASHLSIVGRLGTTDGYS